MPEGVKQRFVDAEKRYAAQRKLTKLKQKMVSGTDMTAEQLVAERDRRLAETRARRPEWFA